MSRWTTRRPFLLLLLLFLLQTCSPGESPKVRTILAAEDAFNEVYMLPDGRRILFSPRFDHSLMLLDVATGEKTLISKDMAWAEWLDDELLYGESGDREARYVVNSRTFVVVRLEPLPGGAETLGAHVREADSIYAIVTDSSLRKYMLLLLQRDSQGNASQGYYITGVRNLEVVLAGIPYATPPRIPSCPLDEKVFSPNGRYYYYNYTGLDIYSQQGELLNSISGKYLHCYGWAWDSSGVYVQERNIGMGGAIIGPLELLLVDP